MALDLTQKIADWVECPECGGENSKSCKRDGCTNGWIRVERK